MYKDQRQTFFSIIVAKNGKKVKKFFMAMHRKHGPTIESSITVVENKLHGSGKTNYVCRLYGFLHNSDGPACSFEINDTWFVYGINVTDTYKEYL